MTYISQQDLDVRLQLTGCKLSELINTYVQDLKWGRKCSEKRLSDLILLNAYVELLECYQVAVDESTVAVPSTVTISWTFDTELEATGYEFNGSVVLSQKRITYASFAADLVTLNSNMPTGYSVTGVAINDANYTLTFNGPCDGTGTVFINTIKSSPALPATTYTLAAGTCAVTSTVIYDNCITETQALKMLDNISKLYRLCFQSLGFVYS